MSEPGLRRLAVVGLGLIGGSVARAARQRGVAREIVGVGRDARVLGDPRIAAVVDGVTTDLAAGVGGADLVVLCAPVGALPDLVRGAWPHLDRGAVCTDVGSVKAEVVRAAAACPARPDVAFVGGHPMAGSERSGFDASDPELFAGRLTLLTPERDTPPWATARVAAFWEAMGSRVRCLPVDQHDRNVARISHLPHLAAYALVAVADGDAVSVAGRGFTDTTRIAASAEALWTDIVRGNRGAVLEALTAYRERLGAWQRLIQDEQWPALQAELARARQVREALA